MKRCPECRRDYYNESLLYCLDDGSELLEGPSGEEPPTLILAEKQPSSVAEGKQAVKRRVSTLGDRSQKESKARKEISDPTGERQSYRKINVRIIWFVIGALSI